jgi:hypothetical protein
MNTHNLVFWAKNYSMGSSTVAFEVYLQQNSAMTEAK